MSLLVYFSCMISVPAEVLGLDLCCLPTQLSELGQLFLKTVLFI